MTDVQARMPGPGEAMVRIDSAYVGTRERSSASGNRDVYLPGHRRKFPLTLGYQAGATVTEMAEGSGIAPGTRVFVNGFATAYAWAAGADPTLNNTGATSLLYWQYLCKIEHKYFDFVGANIPAVAFFKRGFGGDLTPYYVSEGYKSKWIKHALSARRALRR